MQANRPDGDNCLRRYEDARCVAHIHVLTLRQLGLTKIDVCPSQFPENLDHSVGPLNYVLETASAKAIDVYKTELNNPERGEPAIVIAADTVIVSHDGRVLEKPRSEAHHIAMLKMLRDQGEHKVMTAVVVMKPLESAVDPGYAMKTHVEETTVKFDSAGKSPLSRPRIRDAYGLYG